MNYSVPGEKKERRNVVKIARLLEVKQHGVNAIHDSVRYSNVAVLTIDYISLRDLRDRTGYTLSDSLFF